MASVLKCTTDEWNGNSLREPAISNPTWEYVKAAIEALDADKRTIVALDREDDFQMLIGGGSGRYIVTRSDEDETHRVLRNPNGKPSDRILLKAGGQHGYYPADEVCDLEMALRAARWFYDTGEADPPLPWK